MTIVILAAGRGTRFRDRMPKCLSMIDENTLLERTIGLIRKCDSDVQVIVITGYKAQFIDEVVERIGDDGVKTLYNPDFREDQNIISAIAGLNEVDTDVLVLEGDCIFNEIAMSEFVSMIGSNKTSIFTIGKAEEGKKNAIFLSGKDGSLVEFRMGERKGGIRNGNWSNMAGSVLFSKEITRKIGEWFYDSGRDPSTTYYFQPLLEGDFGADIHKLKNGSKFSTFNTQKQYLDIMSEMGVETKIKLIETDSLRHVEGFSEKRVEWLKEKIVSEGIWNKPICIDSDHRIVMDGQHRMEVAKKLGLSVVPSICFKHDEVDFWSLRPKSHEVTYDLIMAKSLSGQIYPYKTVKYAFPCEIPGCAIDIEELL